MITVRCECGGKFKVADQYAGKRGKCPSCGRKIQVPAADGFPSDAEPPADEGFEGVAGLLDEALRPQVSAPALSAAPTTAPKPVPRKKKQSGKSARGLLPALSEHVVSLVVIGLLIAVTFGAAWAGKLAYHRFRFAQALGGGDAQAALKEVSADLSYAVSYANDIGADLDITTRRRMQMLTKVTQMLPDETDLAPLLRLKTNTMAYSAAFGVVRQRAKVDWLIVCSCNSNADGRKFAAEVLRHTFPFGILADAGVAQLAESTSVAEKQALYDKLYAAQHLAYEQKLVGDYRIQFDVTWQSGPEAQESKSHLTPQPRLSIACQERLWTVDFYDQRWTGKIDDLSQLVLAIPTPRIDEDLSMLPRHETLFRAELRLSYEEERLLVSIPYLAYAAASRGRAPLMRDSGTRIGGGTPGVPDGASTRRVTIYNDGVVLSESIEWTLPERPGYSKFDIRLVRAR